jgi:hypothetical protein
MLKNLTIGSLALLGVTIGPSPSQADVFVRVPFVRVYVGQPGVNVRVPFLGINVNNGPPVLVAPLPVPPPPVPAVPAPQNVPQMPPLPPEPAPVVVPPPPTAAVVAPRPQTLNEFASSFRPAAGSYEVVLINPITNHPVKVNFTLPEGSPKVRVFPRRLEFDYGSRRNSIEIRFDRKDTVQVQSR